MLNFDEGRDLVLPQLNVSGFVDSPWEILHFLRSECGWVAEEVEEGQERREGELCLICKINKKSLVP